MLSLLAAASLFSSDALYGKYSVRMSPYSGSSEVRYYFKGDSLILSMKSSVALNTVKFTNLAAIDTASLQPAYIFSDYNMLGKKSRGEIFFSGNKVQMYSIEGEKRTVKEKSGPYQMNDWLILPYFLSYFKDSVYECSMLHGDFMLKRMIRGDTVFWSDKEKKIDVRFLNDTFYYEKAGNITLIRK